MWNNLLPQTEPAPDVRNHLSNLNFNNWDSEFNILIKIPNKCGYINLLIYNFYFTYIGHGSDYNPVVNKTKCIAEGKNVHVYKTVVGKASVQ